MKVSYHTFFITGLVLTTLASIFVRLDQIHTHFAHVDDLIAPTATLNWTASLTSSENALIQFFSNLTQRITYPFQFAFQVSNHSTYAPLQYFFTSLLTIGEMKSNEDILFWYRLPSLIFYVSSLVAANIFLKKILINSYMPAAIICTCILGFSWQNIIYSIQSLSYEIGVFLTTLTFLTLLKVCKENKISIKSQIFYGIYISFLILGQYQLILLVFSVGITILQSRNYQFKFVFQNYWATILITTFTLTATYYLFLSSRLGQSTNWNIGPNREFLYSPGELDYLQAILYTLKFFALNTYITLESLLGITYEGSTPNKIYTLFVISGFMIGLIQFVRSENKEQRLVAMFTVVFLSSYLVLVAFGIFALSPTRHSLIILPFVAIFSAIGLTITLKKKNLITLAFIIFVAFFFTTSYPTMKAQRTTKISEEFVNNIIDRFNPKYLFTYGWTFNLRTMPSVIKRGLTIKEEFRGSYTDIIEPEANVVFISHREETLNGDIMSRFFDLNNHQIELLYSLEQPSNTEVDFSSKTKNGTNSIMVYVYRVSKTNQPHPHTNTKSSAGA